MPYRPLQDQGSEMDTNLTNGAKGLLLMMWAACDAGLYDYKIGVTMAFLVDHSKEGRAMVKNQLDNLIEHEYVEVFKTPRFTSDGRWLGDRV